MHIGQISDVGTVFNMTDGGITAGGAVSQPVSPGSPLFFISFTSETPSPAYCSIVCLSHIVQRPQELI